MWVSVRFSVSLLPTNVVGCRSPASPHHQKHHRERCNPSQFAVHCRAPSKKGILVALRRWRALPATRRTPACGKTHVTLNDSARFRKSDTPARSISTRWWRAMGSHFRNSVSSVRSCNDPHAHCSPVHSRFHCSLSMCHTPASHWSLLPPTGSIRCPRRLSSRVALTRHGFVSTQKKLFWSFPANFCIGQAILRQSGRDGFWRDGRRRQGRVGPAVQRDHGAHGARWPQGVEHHRAAGPAQHARSRNAPRHCAPLSLTPAHAQGEFETRDPALKTLNGLEIGNLVCKGAPAPCVLPRAPACRAAQLGLTARCLRGGLAAGSKSVHLVIGNQRLDGKVVDLKEPLAVMSKVSPSPSQDAAGASAASHGGVLACQSRARCVLHSRRPYVRVYPAPNCPSCQASLPPLTHPSCPLCSLRPPFPARSS